MNLNFFKSELNVVNSVGRLAF